jgi:hypothetical protein
MSQHQFWLSPVPTWQRQIINYIDQVLTEKPTGPQLVKKLPQLSETRRFVPASKSVRHLSLSSARSVQSMPTHLTSLTPISIQSSRLWMGHPSGLFPSSLPIKTLYAPLLFPIRATCPIYLILHVRSPEQYLVSSTDHQAPRYAAFSTPLLPRPTQAKISSTPYSRTTQLMFLPQYERQFHDHKKRHQHRILSSG